MNDHTHLPWQPVAPGFSLKLLRGGGDDDTRVLLLRLEPGTVVPLHRHAGEVHAFNLAGSRRLIETGEVVGPGGYVYEPAVVLVTVRGAMETLGAGGVVTARSTTSAVTQDYQRFAEGAR